MYMYMYIYPVVYCIWDMIGVCTAYILILLCKHFCLAALYMSRVRMPSTVVQISDSL